MTASLRWRSKWRYRCALPLLLLFFSVGIVCFIAISVIATDTDTRESKEMVDNNTNVEEQFIMSFDGFAINVPSAINYKPLYNRYFSNLAHMSMLVNYAVIKRVENKSVKCKSSYEININIENLSGGYDNRLLKEMTIVSRSNKRELINKKEECNSTTQTTNEYEIEVVGTTQAERHVETSILVPLDLSRWRDVNDMCSWSNANRLQAMTSWVESLHIPRKITTAQRKNSTLAAVVITSSQTNSEEYSNTDTIIYGDDNVAINRMERKLEKQNNAQRIYEPTTYDVDCLLDVIEEYNNFVRLSLQNNDDNSTKNAYNDKKNSEQMILLPINTIILNAETHNHANINNKCNHGRILKRKKELLVNEQPHEMHRRISVNVIVYKELLEHYNYWHIHDKENEITIKAEKEEHEYKEKEEQEVEMQKIIENALFNTRRWMNGYVFPYYSLQVRNNLNLLLDNNDDDDDDDGGGDSNSKTEHEKMENEKESKRYYNNNNIDTCLTQSSFMEDGSYSCAPLGGWTHWTSTQNTSWAYNNTSHHLSFVKHTPENSVALLVSATEWSLVPEMAPGADGTASAMSAALAVMDAITRYNERTPHEAISLYVFWVPGEYYGHVGSARIIHDAQYFECDIISHNNSKNEKPQNDSGKNGNETNHYLCTNSIYKDYLNATSIDFTKFSTIIALDQLSFDSSPFAPLYVHVDDRVLHATSTQNSSSGSERRKSNTKQNSAMEHVLTKLQEEYNISRADTHHLRFSPVTTYIDLLPEQLQTQVIFTLARYNTEYINPFVFTPSDVADYSSVNISNNDNNNSSTITAIAEATQVIVNLLIDLTRERYESNKNTNLYQQYQENLTRENYKNHDNRHVSVDHQLLHNLWHCLTVDVHCEYLQLAETFPECAAMSSVPNYATHPFTFAPRATSSECLVAAMLHKLQLPILATPALSLMLNLSLVTNTMPSSSPWHWVESNTYIAYIPEEEEREYRHVHVISTWPVNGIAARVAIIASSEIQTCTLVVGMFVTVLVS